MKRFITILPAELKQEANEYCSQFADDGQYTFQAQLSFDGKEPATHYISNWNMTKSEEFLMKQKYKSYMNEVEEPSDASIIEQLGLKKIIQENNLTEE
jgi:uncharacterized membrane protein